MEDSVGEEERREQGETTAQAVREDGQVGAGRGGGSGGEAGEGGFLSAMASKIGAAMSGGDENGGEDGGTVHAAAASNGKKREEDHGHGGGGIFQKLMSNSHAPSPDSGAPETEEVKTPDAGGEQGGILSSMASRIGMAMSGANGNGNHHGTADAAKTNNCGAVDDRNGQEEDGMGSEANGAGILSTMASKIGMAMSSANGNGDHGTVGDAKMSNGDSADHVKGEEEEKADEANGGGILSAMASKIGMSMSGANGEANHGGSGDDAKTGNGHVAFDSKVDKEGEASGGGLVDQIMSNLPSEDQAPEADEASLLIAIIED